MKIQYLGTAAAEAIPALFCDCKMCAYARKKRGHEIRTRAGAIIDDKLLLDFGPDSYKHMLDNNLDYTHIHSMLITHSHEDHLSVGDIYCRREGFGQIYDDPQPLTIYGNARVGEMLGNAVDNKRLRFEEIKPYETYDIEGYHVTPLEAVHCACDKKQEDRWPVRFGDQPVYRIEQAMIYRITKDGKSILYAHDTDEITEEDLECLNGTHLDLVSLDCTNGRLDCNYIGHMGAEDNVRLRERLMQIGAANDATVFVANHFSHNGMLPEEEISKLLPGFVIAYDSLVMNI